MEADTFDPRVTQEFKVYFAAERAKCLARANLHADYIQQACRVTGVPPELITENWTKAVHDLLGCGLLDRGLYILVAAIGQSHGVVVNTDFLDI
jgi:hypothetical protein